MTLAAIALGANLGDAAASVRDAMQALASLPETRWLAGSPLYRTAPVGYADQPDFVNAVALVETGLTPQELLAALQKLEEQGGRVRSFRNAPRTLDLDLLVYGEVQLDTPELTLPHPRMHERTFVLMPLADVAPDLLIPGCGRVADCLAGLPVNGIEKLAS
ncbi:2-amino-4-hydroxy-6-hydroxymethyldihydropteridine diphosphokinase [Laribacter hongkongensis]|uniref:2-amino-4-hydroxy-6- hydroxymethyldihydropteridine diphosphokinase n=1 Tax=Laribacter hongkongensis TaxID=168471 RepID=UPI001EFDE463|nr:2-amino-4-hydroxy-6-hydroxymethyldihydropteridine diphosphokinase [Laribacter hongkongensis]MCG8991397.1 2-amino-4-hydroxy-6-hydroxymethyldihydropteridine diphosphokinase [Laribacter hongkongensis]MCG9000561.1 2-amino-4-hydroxy-6-hydroxymethyldihydropteridine diphosphokinase [Laribacter hongkongensis]MCG9007026.1 2-amino-4-hydroxy-6-hydroxymethyldihydropteridine diphosphokinase [Laribacter hongkongensis]MCG9015304.1 2-amino-4-hydroxy-6-hydroxymethyldihydropteridine diphosphokinase [Laribacte